MKYISLVWYKILAITKNCALSLEATFSGLCGGRFLVPTGMYITYQLHAVICSLVFYSKKSMYGSTHLEAHIALRVTHPTSCLHGLSRDCSASTTKNEDRRHNINQRGPARVDPEHTHMYILEITYQLHGAATRYVISSSNPQNQSRDHEIGTATGP